jgi:hypothetical protein
MKHLNMRAIGGMWGAAGLCAAAMGQTSLITPLGAVAGDGTFRYTPPAGTIVPAGVGALTAGAGGRFNYSFSPTTVAAPGNAGSVGDVAWQMGWFFRVQGENREFAFINAAVSTAAGITCTRSAVFGNNLGTQNNSTYVYDVERNVVGGYKFQSVQRFEIFTTPIGPAARITNTVTNTGPVGITLNLFWAADLDCLPNFGDDRFELRPTGIRFSTNGVANPGVFAARGNSSRFAVRAGAVPGFNTLIMDTMTNNIAENLLNNAPPAATVDNLDYGLQWTITLAPGQSFEAATALQHQRIKPCGLSDIAGPGGVPLPDGEVTADDVIVFINWFTANDPRADVAGPGGVPAADGEFTADDVILFISRFTSGC